MNFRLLTICLLLLFVNLNTQAQTVINKDQIFHQATWIWYPGDYEIWLSNQMQNRRTDRGSFFPVFWKVDSHYPLIDFHKEFYLTAPEEVFIVTEGNYNVKLDGKPIEGTPKKILVPAGKHKINVKVFSQAVVPAIFVSGQRMDR